MLSAPIDRVWFALGRAYENLGIPIATVDRTNWFIANAEFRGRLNIAGVAMTKLLDCGFGPSGPYAALNRITFDIRTQLRPADGGQVEVRTLILATADPAEGISGRATPCTTTGGLEDLIVKRIEAALAGAS